MRSARGGKRVVTALLVATLLVAGAGVRASVVVPLSLRQLIEAADVIADGEVVAVHATADRGRVERVVSIRVLETWKGSGVELIHVRLPGGTLGRTRVVVPGAPEVAVGDRRVWFVARTADGSFASVGLHQGVVRVWASPADGRQLVSVAPALDTVGTLRRGDGTRRPRPLTSLRADVRAVLEEAAR
jgi:hypothetical protein